jgi:hypothetical protein
MEGDVSVKGFEKQLKDKLQKVSARSGFGSAR